MIVAITGLRAFLFFRIFIYLITQNGYC
jgi:hypothetical protein